MENKAIKYVITTNKQNVIILNNTDRDKLISSMKNPPEPNEDLKGLFNKS